MRVVAEIDGAGRGSRSGSLTAAQAVVLYEGEVSGVNATLAARHEITVESSGRPQLGPGVPLDRRTLDIILRKVAGQQTATERKMLPANLVYFDEGRMVWHMPARRAPVWFRTGRADFDRQFKDREVLWPPLLFRARPGALDVWALAGNDRPTAESLVYLVPAYNMYLHGAMCAGTARLPDTLAIGNRERFEQAFYETEFTHSNYGGGTKPTSHPRGHDCLWRQMIWRQAFRGYPTRYLMPAYRKATERQLTVGEVVSE